MSNHYVMADTKKLWNYAAQVKRSLQGNFKISPLGYHDDFITKPLTGIKFMAANFLFYWVTNMFISGRVISFQRRQNSQIWHNCRPALKQNSAKKIEEFFCAWKSSHSFWNHVKGEMPPAWHSTFKRKEQKWRHAWPHILSTDQVKFRILGCHIITQGPHCTCPNKHKMPHSRRHLPSHSETFYSLRWGFTIQIPDTF